MTSKVLFAIALTGIACAAHAGVVLDIAQPRQGDWTQVALRDDGPSSLTATTQNGAGDELDEWRITYVAPPSTRPYAASNNLAVIYESFAWDPGTDGGIAGVDVSFDLGRAFSSFVGGFSGFVRPVVRQAGTIYSVAFSSIAINDSFNPAKAMTWSLLNTSNWITIDSGTGLDLSASGDDIYFGFRWDLAVNCNGINGCNGATTVASLDNLRFDISAINAVPEPGGLTMFLTGLGLLGFTARRRRKNFETHTCE